ncbi:MAG: hypothetical protein AB8B53_07430 [Flavobacteriales bacterium]
MNRLKIILLGLSVVFISSCRKSNLNDYPDFEGDWRGATNTSEYFITVEEDGDATYEKISSNSEITHNGRLIVKEDEVKIGFKRLDINQYPTLSATSAEWFMELDGILYTRW